MKTLFFLIYSVALIPENSFNRQEIIVKSAETIVEQKGINRTATSTVTARLPREKVWKILTSYDNMEDFLPSVKNSTLLSRKDNKVVVDYSLKIAWQELRFVQECTELNNNQYLTFRTIKGDLKNYEGSWTLEETADGTKISYYVSVDYDSVLPDWMINSLMKTGISYLIESIAETASSVQHDS